MGTTRHEGYFDPERMPSREAAINQAAHAAISLANNFPGNDGAIIKATSAEFSVSVLETVDRINATRALIPTSPSVEGYM